jgi:hypothetical protein
VLAEGRREALGLRSRYAHAVGSNDQKTWDELVFEKIEPGVDPSIIRENLKLTPTERIEKMQRALALVDDLRKAYGNRSPGRPGSAR